MRIVCATDLLATNDATIERAGLLADQLNAHLSLLHVVVPGESPPALEQTLRSAHGRMQARVRPPQWRAQRTPAWEVHAGSPARIIPEAVARSRAQLLVLGAHRKRPLRDAFEGTIAGKVLATKRCPVLVVRDKAAQPYRHVLMALDLSDASASTIHAMESLVLSPQASATVVHAHEPPYHALLAYANVGTDSLAAYAEHWKREAHRSVRELLADECAHAARYGIHVVQKPAAEGILQAVGQYSPDLLVMGTHGGGSLRRALVGSVANRVLHQTGCDVLIIPEGSFDISVGLMDGEAFDHGGDRRVVGR